MATTKAEKEKLIHNTFRRSSLTDHGEQKIEIHRIPTILNGIGQPFDIDKLTKWVEKHDPEDTGYLDYEGYTKLCKEFIKHPAALANMGDDFSFKNLIGKGDFAYP